MGRRKCACLAHAEFCQNSDFILKKISSRHIDKDVIETLKSRNLISQYGGFLCTTCAKYAIDNFMPADHESRSDATTDNVNNPSDSDATFVSETTQENVHISNNHLIKLLIERIK